MLKAVDEILVKNEVDIENALPATTFVNTLPPSAIKEEDAIEIESVKAEELADYVNSGANIHEILHTIHGDSPQLVESFVIYELEANAPTTVATAPSAVEPKAKLPILLNDKLRKRPRIQIAATPAQSLPVRVPPAAAKTSLPSTAANTELKVKCFCRLGRPTDAAATLPTNGVELKRFFEQMFNETCALTKERQRIVKMTLLEAICQAEDDMEAGRYCDKCCG